MTGQITKYGPCLECGEYKKPCKCQDETRLKEMDLKCIKSNIRSLELADMFRRCPDVLEKITGAGEGALADIKIDDLNNP